MAAYGQPKTLVDSQKLHPDCPWDNPFYFPNSDTALMLSSIGEYHLHNNKMSV